MLCAIIFQMSYLMTLQLGPVERVCRQSGTLESVSDVRQICNPAQVYRDRVERDEETAEQ